MKKLIGMGILVLSFSFIIFIIFIFIFLLSYLQYKENYKTYQNQLKEWKLWLEGKSVVIPTTVIHKIYDRNEILIGEYTPYVGSFIKKDRCKQLEWLQKATVVSEDKNFYYHNGIDYRGILRALLINLITLSKKQGGGTITQQLARNLFTGQEKTYQRKILETLLAYDIEKIFSKEEILCLYLNKIYMGRGRIGAEEASWFYFNKPPENLTPAEASMLVGLYPAPEIYNPLKDINLSLNKQEIVLEKLVKANYLNKEQKDKEILYFKRNYDVKPEDKDPGLIALYGASKNFRINLAPVINEMVKKFLEENIPEERLLKESLKIYTTIDFKSQKKAFYTLKTNIQEIRKKTLLLYEKAKIDKKYLKKIQGIILSMDVPSGHIRSMESGFEIFDTGILSYRINQMKKPVGSTIKGFLYALALEQNVYDINTKVIDEPVNFNGYQPKNWYAGYKGTIPLKQAIAESVNTVAVKTLNEIGIDFFLDEVCQSLGISFYDCIKRFKKNLTLALGTIELTPMELTTLYAAIVNQGYKITPVLILKVENSEGIVYYEDTTVQKDIAIIKSETAAKTIELLKSVLEDGTAKFIGEKQKRDPNYMPYEVAGKTGTNQFPNELKAKFNQIQGIIKDSWFVGFNPENITTVWIGGDETVPITSEARAVQIWAEFFSNTFTEPLNTEFPKINSFRESSNDILLNKGNKEFE
ncbi:MAG: transglycosylase domain-containing protein [Leptonema sp. (in: bacteria)]